jgi:hypothetical protein
MIPICCVYSSALFQKLLYNNSFTPGTFMLHQFLNRIHKTSIIFAVMQGHRNWGAEFQQKKLEIVLFHTPSPNLAT